MREELRLATLAVIRDFPNIDLYNAIYIAETELTREAWAKSTDDNWRPMTDEELEVMLDEDLED